MKVSYTFGSTFPATAQVTRLINKVGEARFKLWWKRLPTARKNMDIVAAVCATRAENARVLFLAARKEFKWVGSVGTKFDLNVKIGRVTITTRVRVPAKYTALLSKYEETVTAKQKNHIADTVAHIIEMWNEADEMDQRSEAVADGECPDCGGQLSTLTDCCADCGAEFYGWQDAGDYDNEERDKHNEGSFMG
jgi:hypothetical protein